jgi:transposase
MPKLEGMSTERLRTALDRAEDAKAATRLMVAIAYKDGVDVATLSERYDIPKSTVYYWFDRLEERPLDAAVTDESPPGRPSKLSVEDRETVREWLATTPREQGLDADEWTPELLRDRIADAFGVTYSLGHVRRIRREESKNQ